jgi:hypothetical protein
MSHFYGRTIDSGSIYWGSNPCRAANMKITQERSLGVLSKEPKQDVFHAEVTGPSGGKWILAGQSTPSALTRTTPLIFVCVVSLLILGLFSPSLRLFICILIVLVLCGIFYIVIFQPDRIVIADARSTALGDKNNKVAKNSDVDYQPDTDIAKISQKKSLE